MAFGAVFQLGKGTSAELFLLSKTMRFTIKRRGMQMFVGPMSWPFRRKTCEEPLFEIPV